MTKDGEIKIRRLRSEWREMAAAFGRHAWHVPEWRYFDADTSPRSKVVEAAIRQARMNLSYELIRAVRHKRSRKAMEAVFAEARTLGAIGLFALQEQNAQG